MPCRRDWIEMNVYRALLTFLTVLNMATFVKS
jgi:hypothetical protein